MGVADNVIVRAILECKMAPVYSMIFIAGFSLIILIASLIFLIPLSRKMTSMANVILKFDVRNTNIEQLGT